MHFCIIWIIPVRGEKLWKWLPISSSPPCSVLLPTLRLPPLVIKSENIWGNKYYVRECDSRDTAFRSKNRAWKVGILMSPALDCFRTSKCNQNDQQISNRSRIRSTGSGLHRFVSGVPSFLSRFSVSRRWLLLVFGLPRPGRSHHNYIIRPSTPRRMQKVCLLWFNPPPYN